MKSVVYISTNNYRAIVYEDQMASIATHIKMTPHECTPLRLVRARLPFMGAILFALRLEFICLYSDCSFLIWYRLWVSAAGHWFLYIRRQNDEPSFFLHSAWQFSFRTSIIPINISDGYHLIYIESSYGIYHFQARNYYMAE